LLLTASKEASLATLGSGGTSSDSDPLHIKPGCFAALWQGFAPFSLGATDGEGWTEDDEPAQTASVSSYKVISLYDRSAFCDY
jgi:hypothetical protein